MSAAVSCRSSRSQRPIPRLKLTPEELTNMWYRAEGLWDYTNCKPVPDASSKFTPPPFTYEVSVDPDPAPPSVSGASSKKGERQSAKELRAASKAFQVAEERKALIKALAVRDEAERAAKAAAAVEEAKLEAGGLKVQKRYITPAPWESEETSASVSSRQGPSRQGPR